MNKYFEAFLAAENNFVLSSRQSRDIAQAISRWPGFEPGSGQVEFVVNKVAMGQVFSEYFCFPCQCSLHQILNPHNHPGQILYARSGRRAKWTQFGFHPPL
jgi:hypothetical protein